MAGLTDWMGDANEITAPKPLQMAKALRQRKVAVANAPNAPRAALSGSGNIFQRRRQGIDDVVANAVK